MSLGVSFSRLPRPLALGLLPALGRLNLMRAMELRLLAPWVPQVSGWRVLDVGCGHGLYSLDLVRRGASLLGFDLQHPALATARQTAQGLGFEAQALFVTADGAALPVAGQSFDLVVCNCVLEHIADDGAALRAMARALRPGGILYLAVDNADHDLALGFLDRLSPQVKGWLLRSQVAAAPSVSAGLDARLDDLYAVRRRYNAASIENRLASLGFALLDSRPYLTGVGAAHYEAFHALRGLNPDRGLGRWLFMISSFLLYPFAARSDSRPGRRGYGLALVARKAGEAAG